MEAADLLRRARARAGLTLRQLGAAAGTSHSTLSAYESGAKVPTVATLDRIIGAAGFSLDGSLSHRWREADGMDRGDELIAVLDLAEQFPAHHAPGLTYPRFGPS